MHVVSMSEGRSIIIELCDRIVENKAWLSEIDGAIGDGDHGINMSKGFSQCKAELEKTPEVDLEGSLTLLSKVLMESIGGSMGPLYGSVFLGMASALDGKSEVDAQCYGRMWQQGLEDIQDISDAKVGDKCLMDTLVPSVAQFNESVEKGKTFEECLNAMIESAEQGMESTRDLAAKIGRASRLGERSRGVLDAGAVSCCLIIKQLAESSKSRLK